MPAPSFCRLAGTNDGEAVVYPILRNGSPFAILVVSRPRNSAAPERSMTLGRQLADQFALGLSNAHMLQELHALSVGSLTALARTIDAASPWTGGHSERVTQCAVEIARRMGVSDDDRTQLHHGGLLHDIGKIGIPATILDKADRLTEDELVIMQSHPVIGAGIVQTVRAFRELRAAGDAPPRTARRFRLPARPVGRPDSHPGSHPDGGRCLRRTGFGPAVPSRARIGRSRCRCCWTELAASSIPSRWPR